MKDIFGNELVVGDLVLRPVRNEFFTGIVTELNSMTEDRRYVMSGCRVEHPYIGPYDGELKVTEKFVGINDQLVLIHYFDLALLDNRQSRQEGLDLGKWYTKRAGELHGEGDEK